MSSESVVEVESICHRYGDRTALDDVSFDVVGGAIFGLLGPNGGGKTTLFKILTTSLRPGGGSARIAGADVVRDAVRVRERIGVVFQQPSLDDKLTVTENLTCQGNLYGLRGKALAGRCESLLDRFGVGDRANDRVETLSGGLKRRVEIAKCLLHRPPVVILDEPSTGLDPAARSSLMDHLHELRRDEQVTVLLTTHLLDEADRCDRLAILDAGRLVALDSPDALKRSVGGEVLSVTARDAKDLSAKVRDRFQIEPDIVGGVLRIEHPDGHSLISELMRSFPGEIDSVTVGRPTLEDVFIHKTGHRMDTDVDRGMGERTRV